MIPWSAIACVVAPVTPSTGDSAATLPTVLEGLPGWELGERMAAGDTDGDGVDDLLVGVARFACGPDREPAAYLLRHVASAPVADQADVTFDGCPEGDTGEGRLRVALADVTGDGLPEALLDGFDRLVVHDVPRRGTRHPAGAYATVRDGGHLLVGEVDGDGIADLVVEDGVWFGPIAGTVYADDFPPVVEDPGRIGVAGLADLDHDGVDNLLLSDCCGEFSSNALWVADDPLPRDGIAALTTGVSGGGQRVAVGGDLTGDGWPDVVIAHTDHYDDPVVVDNPVWILDRAASGGIEALAWATFAPAGALDIALGSATGDFDGDGATDSALGWTDGRVLVYRGPLARGVHTDADADVVLLGDEAPVPVQAAGYTGLSAPDGFGEWLVAGDFDGDGRDDLAVGAARAGDGGHIYVFWGAGL